MLFIFVPLIFSGIFYASNGPTAANKIDYVDALFMTVSAMTVTGLNSVLLARLTLWQTVILFVSRGEEGTRKGAMLTILLPP
jgi:hypothetical protein